MSANPTITLCLTLALVLVVGCTGRAQQPSSTDEREQLQFRTWTDATGRYQTEAAMIKFADGKVHLKKRDGRTAALSIDRLGEAGSTVCARETRTRGPVERERETSSIAAVSSIADWPQFRGPGGLGTSRETGLPTTWSATENIAWKTELPGPGSSSPIVVGNSIFLTYYTGYGVPGQGRSTVEDLKRYVVCLNRADGRILWTRPVPDTLTANPRPGVSIRARGSDQSTVLHGYASSTPASDGQRLYCFFGNSGVYAFTTAGEPAWHTHVGDETHHWGSATSLILFDDLVIVNASVEGGELVALSRDDGSVAWRAGGIVDAWNTPALIDRGGERELVVAMREKTLGFDPATGQSLWQSGKGWSGYVCPSVVTDGEVVYSLGGNMAMAIRAGGRGDVTGTHRVWTAWKGSNVSSPVCHEGHLYWSNTRGIAYCMNAESGKVVYEQRIEPQPGLIYASPVLADGRLYYVSRTNGAFVVAAEPQFKLLAHNTIETDRSVFNASPAVVHGQLFLRSNRYVYCISERP